MITPMTRFSFILLSGEEGKLLETLQGTGLVDITRGSRAVDKESQDLYAQAELVSGLIQGLGKMEIPEGTQRTDRPSYRPSPDGTHHHHLQHLQYARGRP